MKDSHDSYNINSPKHFSFCICELSKNYNCQKEK